MKKRGQKTGETPFYLHFEAIDAQMVRDNIEAFFDFLEDKKPEKEDLDITGKNKQPMKLLVSCTSGLTSSYFACTMKNTLDKAGISIIVDAVRFADIDKVQARYDYILLAPQIAYKLPEYREKYGDRVMKIDSRDFASYDVIRVMNRLIRHRAA